MVGRLTVTQSSRPIEATPTYTAPPPPTLESKGGLLCTQPKRTGRPSIGDELVAIVKLLELGNGRRPETNASSPTPTQGMGPPAASKRMRQ